MASFILGAGVGSIFTAVIREAYEVQDFQVTALRLNRQIKEIKEIRAELPALCAGLKEK